MWLERPAMLEVTKVQSRLATSIGRARSMAWLAAFVALRPQDRPSIVVERHEVPKPRFPAIDAHLHLHGPFAGPWGERPTSALIAALDEAGVEKVVDVDGGTGEELRQEIRRFERLGDRVLVFSGIDVARFAESDDFGKAMADDLRHGVDMGARGLKVWKVLGLRARDWRGSLIAIDDERLDPLWAAAGELGVPIIIHVADPRAFFEPNGRSNERWEELRLHPDWHYWPPRERGRADQRRFPAYDELLEQFSNVLRKHRGTTFIGAHLAGSAEDLGWVGRALESHPNLFVDISARVAELGRQPYSARDLFLRFPDRILFATDNLEPGVHGVYYRLLETRDEYFDYHWTRVPQNGRWRIYGLDLPDPVLQAVYSGNAERIIWKSVP